MSRIACIDLSGTILQHQSGREWTIPIMPELLCAMRDHGWECHILTKWGVPESRKKLRAAGMDPDRSIIYADNKGKAIEKMLHDHEDCTELVFIDDRPDNLESALAVRTDRLRILGFAGSRKYCPDLSSWCLQNGVELALSPIDLAETLEVSLSKYEPPSGWAYLDTQDLALLIPGTDHPRSNTEGETHYADHRRVFGQFNDSPESTWDYDMLYQNIAWITCRQCLWKILVRTVLMAAKQDIAMALGVAYKAHEYTRALVDHLTTEKLDELKPHFQQAFAQMELGLDAIGRDAEECRPRNRGIDRNRINLAKEQYEKIYG